MTPLWQARLWSQTAVWLREGGGPVRYYTGVCHGRVDGIDAAVSTLVDARAVDLRHLDIGFVVQPLPEAAR